MARGRWLGLLVALTVGLAACGGSPSPPTNAAATQTRAVELAERATLTAPTPGAAAAVPAHTPTHPPPPSPTHAAPPTATGVLPTATSAPPAPTPAPIAREAATVADVVDGDTIRVRLADGRVESVRYIGIDTPETVDPRTTVECFGREAAAKNRELVEGREVLLERDVSERDRYDRLLRYVWVRGDDGILRHVNEELVKWGFAAASSYPPDVRYQALFGSLERAARDQRLGLWGQCASGHDPLPTSTPTSRPVPPPPPPPPPPPARPAPQPAPPPPAPPPSGGRCDPSYPTVCIPPPPPDLDCGEVPHRRFAVRPPDPHRFDGDNDGVGCES